MENKINIAELLKDCPQGMELDCSMYDDLVFVEVDLDAKDYPITTQLTNGTHRWFTSDGRYELTNDAKCVIFPKGRTTWEGFVPPCKFKDGDIIFTHANCLKVGVGNTWISIFKEKRNGGVATYVDYAEDRSDYYSDLDGDKALLCMESDILRQRFATEEEKEKLFDAIKANGFKWNAETKTLEKLIEPKFKVGDKVTDKNKFIYRITEITDKGYKLHDLKTTFITFEEADLYFVKVVDIFDITTLKPFDKVLTRDNDSQKWGAELFSFYDNENEDYHFQLVGIVNARYCIPYEGNEYLLGTTEDCDEYYKTWK